MILLLPNATLKLLQCHPCLISIFILFFDLTPLNCYYKIYILCISCVFLHPLDGSHSFQHHVDDEDHYGLIQIKVFITFHSCHDKPCVMFQSHHLFLHLDMGCPHLQAVHSVSPCLTAISSLLLPL